MQSKHRHLPALTRRSSHALLAMICGGWLSAAHAAPNCTSVVATPADGIIPALTTVTNSQSGACFDNAVTPIVNNGVIVNEASGGLTNTGALTSTNGSAFRNYGTFQNYTGAQFANSGAMRNYAGATFTNNGTFTSYNGSIRNDAQWINDTGATMQVFGTFDTRSGGTFTNNGTARMTDGFVDAGSTFNNNGAIVDYSSTNFSYILNQGALNNNAGASLNIKLFSNYGTSMTNAGAIVIQKDGRLNNKTSLENKSSGTIVNSGQIRNLVGGILNNAGLLRNNPDATIDNAGTLDNTGTVEIGAGSAVLGAGRFVQTAGITYVEGTMAQSAVSILGGDLVGPGTVTAPVTLAGGRIVAEGLTIDGDLHFDDGTTHTTIGASDFTVLNVLGTTYLTKGTFSFDFGSYIPTVGESWTFLTGDISGSLDDFLVDIYQVGNILFDLDITASGLRLTAVANPSTVPVPASAWLFGSALLGLIGGRRFARGG